jgi:two-component system, NarL family, sensor histidine kinase UhpB
MSLRFRLIGLVCTVLVVSLGLGVVVAYSNARHSVRREMRAALAVGRQTIETALAQLRDLDDASDDLDRLVASFDGDRHLRVWLDGRAPTTTARSEIDRAPEWFVHLIGVAPQIDRIPVRIASRDYGRLFIETDPYNETVEVWDEFIAGLVAPGLFCGLTILLIYVFVGRLVRPLDRVAEAMADVGAGDYRTRFVGRLPPELARLRDSFNRMATRLAESDADNRRLTEQLLSLQDQERAELARDLHDEVSPFLFAIGVDAGTAGRLIAQNRVGEALAHVQSVTEAVCHIQQQVRRMLGRLRPMDLEEVGLPQAIEDIVAFWRRRRPEVAFDVVVSVEPEGLSEATAQTICRIVQEGVSNAMRHAAPASVTIVVDRARHARIDADDVVIRIADDGCGMATPQRIGYGLRGIAERVGAIGGSLTLSNRSGAGLALTAVLPCAPSDCRVAASAKPSEP